MLSLTVVWDVIINLCGMLSLTVVWDVIINCCVWCGAQDRAQTLFKQVHEGKALKGRSNDAIASACMYIACRQEGVPRTFKGQRRHLIVTAFVVIVVVIIL